MFKISATKRLLKFAILTFILVTSSLTAIFVAAQDETGSDTMSKTILQINYQFNVSTDEFVALVTPAAEPIAATPGLIWKVWLVNEDSHEAGGIYLFESREAAQAFVSSPSITGFAAHPAISNFNAKLFGIDETLSQITRGPIEMTAPA